MSLYAYIYENDFNKFMQLISNTEKEWRLVYGKLRFDDNGIWDIILPL